MNAAAVFALVDGLLTDDFGTPGHDEPEPGGRIRVLAS